MKVNFECNELIIDKKPFVFDSALISLHLNSADTLILTKYKFLNDKVLGLKMWEQISSDKSVVLKNFNKPSWIDFEGYFEIIYSDTIYFLATQLFKLQQTKLRINTLMKILV